MCLSDLRLQISDLEYPVSDLPYCRIPTGEPVGTHADPIQEAQRPHQEDRAEGALPLPAPERRGDPLAYCRGFTGPFEPGAEVDVLHDRNVGEPSELLEDRTPDKHRLISC